MTNPARHLGRGAVLLPDEVGTTMWRAPDTHPMMYFLGWIYPEQLMFF